MSEKPISQEITQLVAKRQVLIRYYSKTGASLRRDIFLGSVCAGVAGVLIVLMEQSLFFAVLAGLSTIVVVALSFIAPTLVALRISEQIGKLEQYSLEQLDELLAHHKLQNQDIDNDRRSN